MIGLPRGEQVEALAVNVGGLGEPVTLSIRPERVRLNGASEQCANRFPNAIRHLRPFKSEGYVCG